MSSNTKTITNIALGVAAIIGGGFAIYQFSSLVPIPGMKFILMSPYLSLMFYIIMERIRNRKGIVLIGTAFSGVMVFINIFMGLSLFLGALFAQISIIFIHADERRAFIGSIVYSTASTIIALLVAKYLIGGAYLTLQTYYIFIFGLLSLLLGWVGAKLGANIMKQVFYASRNQS